MLNACHQWVVVLTVDSEEFSQGSGEKTVGEALAFCCLVDRNRVASNSLFDIFCFQAEHPLKKDLFKKKVWKPALGLGSLSGEKKDRGYVYHPFRKAESRGMRLYVTKSQIRVISKLTKYEQGLYYLITIKQLNPSSGV